MKRRTFIKTIPAITLLPGTLRVAAEELETIKLLPPQKSGGKSVLASLQERRTDRNISSEELAPQVLSNLLWAAFGVNRAEGSFGKPGRTAASASNSQEIDLYLAMSKGVYMYEAVSHSLIPVVEGDFRGRAGRRNAKTAPVNIFYVVDLSRYILADWQPDKNIMDPEVQKSYYYVATGLIASNVYLFAASNNLAAWFHNCNKVETVKEFKLKPQQRVLFAQSVGYQAK